MDECQGRDVARDGNDVMTQSVMLTVAAHARDAADLRMLLRMLGLVDAPQVDAPHGTGVAAVRTADGGVRRCPSNHPLTAENVYWWGGGDKQVRWRCVQCRRAWERRRDRTGERRRRPTQA